MITNQNWVNKYRPHLKFSQTYINWVTWPTDCGTIYKNIGKLKKKQIQDVKLYA